MRSAQYILYILFVRDFYGKKLYGFDTNLADENINLFYKFLDFSACTLL